MSKSTRRALRVTLTVAGMAVLCASFVGTAAAAPSIDDASDARNTIENNAPKAPSTAELTNGGLLHNGVVDAELPKLDGVSYEMSSFSVVPASSPGDNEDEDDICHGLNGYHEYDHDTKVQVPCQSSGNDIEEGTFEIHGTPIASPVSVPGIEEDGGDSINQSGDSVAPLTGPGALTDGLKAPEQLNNLNGEKVAVTPV